MAMYFEVTLLGTRVTEQVINRLNFTSSSDNTDISSSLRLLEALGFDSGDPTTPMTSTVLAAFLNAQTTSYQLDEISIRNLFSVTDFVTQPVGGAPWAGKLVPGTGEGLVSFVASKLRTNRVRTDVRRGTLSLTGGTEADTGANDEWSSSYIAWLTNLCTHLNAPPSATDGVETALYRPSVFGKERYPVPGSDPVRYAYRYYQDPAEFAAHVALGVVWSPVARISSQVSRKVGRGA